MRIYFGTNRNPNDPVNPTDFGTQISLQGITDLRFGWAEVTGRNLDRIKLEVASETLAVDPKKAAVNDLSDQKLGSKQVFEEVRKEMVKKKQDCLIFIHGYNVSFHEAVQCTAKLANFYKERPMTYFLFTWPSDGSLLPFKAYASDRDDARASGAALGRGLQKFAHFLRDTRPEDLCGQSAHLFAHSMGNYALRWALQTLLSSSGKNLRRLLDQILLFAADEDDDAFELSHKLRSLPDMARRVTVYHNPGDKALVVSDLTKGNPDRLGAGGPRIARALPDKVSVVTCENVIKFKDDPTGHGYYGNNEVVREDVLAVLAGRKPQDIGTRRYQPETRSFRLKGGRK